MSISFFEEFPTSENLSRLKLVNWSTKLYLATRDLEEFLSLQSRIKSRRVKKVIYWPLLKKKEGYWFSPFSERKILKIIFQELKGRKIPLMLDLELPTTQNPFLYLTQLFNFGRNKKLIQNFIENYSGEVYLAEYSLEGKHQEKLLKFLGLHYKNSKAKTIKMVYHSMHNFDKKFFANELKRGKKEFGEGYLVAYGTIAWGGLKGTSLCSQKNNWSRI